MANIEKRRNILFTIGIDKYQSSVWKDLHNAVLDCKELIKILTERYSFEEYPYPLYDDSATKKDIFDSLNAVRNYLDPEDNLILFFAGHGHMHPQTGRGYWIPYEGTSDPSTWIENSVIKDFIQDFNTEHVWLIADACFSGTFLTKTRDKSIEKSYENLDQRKSRWMLASGREEKVSDGTPGLHSPFFKYLSRYLRQNSNHYTCVTEIIKYVQIITANNSNQSPIGAVIQNIGDDAGEMVLILKDEYVVQRIEITHGTTHTPTLRQELSDNQKGEKRFAAGKEILIVKSFNENYDMLIVENFRFNDAGHKKSKYKGDEVIFSSKDKEARLTLYRRFATWQGLTRYLEMNVDKYKSLKMMAIHATDDIETAEDRPSAMAHADYLQEMLDFNKDPMGCLHCGEKISTNDSYLIEIDEIDLKSNVGNVHKNCLRPADRILGRSGYKELPPSYLINFNHTEWIELWKKGQGQLKGLSNRLPGGKIATVSWNPEKNMNTGSYCIKIHYDNGSKNFMNLGKDIHRFKKEDIDYELDQMNQHLKESMLQEDPPAIIVETRMYGGLKYLSRLKSEKQTLAKVVSYEKQLYSKQFEENKQDIQNDYAPLGLVMTSGDILIINTVIPLISKIEDFDSFHNNWKEVLGDLEECTIKIIASDIELDSYLQSFFSQQLQPIIDPLFNLETQELESGFIVKSFPDLIQEAQKIRSNRNNWKEGDRVKIVFPGVDTDKHATGVLLTDAFIDEIGEQCAIFQAIENGKEQEESVFKMPVKLFERLI